MISKEIIFLEYHIGVLKLLRDIFTQPNNIYYYDDDIKHRRNRIIEAYNELNDEQQRRYIEIYTLYIIHYIYK